jgi:hypothetical protein
MNLSNGQSAFPRGDKNTGAVGLGGSANAAPANFTVGAVGFGPNWTVEDAMAASIVRLECENDELRARVAVLEAEQQIIARERNEAREMAEELLERNAKQAVEIVRLKEAQ